MSGTSGDIMKLSYPLSMVLAAGGADMIIDKSGMDTFISLQGGLGAGLGGYAAVQLGFNPLFGAMIALSVQNPDAIGTNLGMAASVAFVAPYIYAFLIKEEIKYSGKL